ncbi:hypothetical protein HAZT_HAZT001376 [Hyalella azteca]|uniref:G-protein coupled receptors family 1 profile domain-containing protein n=1 Tax=Hyalella azteca TaxID=294128 RepID=A0A6A0H6Z2_HYAAZ|nr:hypothetical protein HAZT_HAZT001376 [Hyalella azteca]
MKRMLIERIKFSQNMAANESGPWVDDFEGSGFLNTTEATHAMSDLEPEIEQMKVQLEEMRFVVQIVLVPFITVIGVCGNIITIAVLTRKSMRSSTNFYLTALALSDMLYLLLFFSLSLQHHPGMREPHTWVYWHFSRFAMWFVDASKFVT